MAGTIQAYSVDASCSDRLGIKLTKSSSNHPQTDGQTERTIQTLNRLLRTYANTNHQNWDRFLPQMVFVYNSTPNRILKMSPFEADLGFIPNPPLPENTKDSSAQSATALEFIKHTKALTPRTQEFLESAQTEMETQNNQKRTPLIFKSGKYQKIQPFNKRRFRF